MTTENPDRFLAVVGGFGGFVFGTANLNIVGGLAVAVLMALFTLLIANLDTLPPEYGPHH